MNRSLLLVLASLLFSAFNLFYLFKTSSRENKMRTIYPPVAPVKHRDENKSRDIIPQNETLEEQFLKNITLKDQNQDMV